MDIVSRARNIVTTPQAEWPVIASEPADTVQLYTGYVVILAAIPLVFGLIHQLFGGLSFGRVVMIAVVGYVASLIDVAVVALLSSKLAPYFGGVDNTDQGFKLAAYGATAAWLGGIFLLLPWIGGILRLLCGLYSIYLYWLGVPDLMAVPAERRLGFVIVVIIATIVVAWIIAIVLLSITGLPLLMLR
jgi:hypothetical protein